MKARIVDNLTEVIEDYFEGAERYSYDPVFQKLCKRIEGKVVDLIFTGKDAFEKKDNDYWLPNCCWDEIKDS